MSSSTYLVLTSPLVLSGLGRESGGGGGGGGGNVLNICLSAMSLHRASSPQSSSDMVAVVVKGRVGRDQERVLQRCEVVLSRFGAIGRVRWQVVGQCWPPTFVWPSFAGPCAARPVIVRSIHHTTVQRAGPSWASRIFLNQFGIFSRPSLALDAHLTIPRAPKAGGG